MNNIAISGRLTKDIELTKTASGTTLARFNVAVTSEIKDENGERKADFFPCIAWRETAEAIQKFFHKGSPIELFGTMNSRTYNNKDGVRQLIWEINVKGWGFPPVNKDDQETEETPKETKSKKSKKESQADLIPVDDDDDLPF